MRPIQTLYLDHGRLYCPIHGQKYVTFTNDDGCEGKLCCGCSATLPDGTHCAHSAEWNSFSEIHDPELEAIARAAANDLIIRVEQSED